MHMKRCSTSSVIKEMQIKTTMRYHFTPTRMFIIKKTDNNKDMEKLESSFVAGENETGCNHFGKQFGSFSVKHRGNIRPSNSTPRYIPKRKENICPYKSLYMNVHCTITHSNEKVETTQMSYN